MLQICIVPQFFNPCGKFCFWALMSAIYVSVTVCQLPTYIILHNCGGRFELMLLFWFTIFAKIDRFEKF